ncbi:uncharacterized protein LOC110733776 [Chenopodium quinoa]|uniref:uncharacterized protein LOC110733776 n=1 Tax=Chenopodium quinoa TaxID=63459 RepID=UPI000B78B46D|nr:uncharacterized protein LOC110733776 [Chenopodium quinoa]
MSNLAKLEFVALDIIGKNYLSWVLDAEIHLDAKGLGETIKEANKATPQDKAKAMIFLLHHLYEGLKNEFLTVKDPQILWSNLKERYDHQKTVILPRARYDWLNLRLQDFKFVSEYNSTMFKITSQLKLCGENITDAEMLEKTYSTFYANNIVMRIQYREKGFQKYFELISCLLVAEKNNELLMKNHESHPTGFTPFPDANVTTHNKKETKNRDHSSSSGRGEVARGRGQWRGRGHARGFSGYGRGRGGHFTNSHSHQKWECRDDKVDKEKSVTNICYHCGVKGHWSRVCRTPNHLVELYQESLKKGKKVEANLVLEDGEGDFDFGNANHLEVVDFLTSSEGNNFDFCNTTHLEVANFFNVP